MIKNELIYLTALRGFASIWVGVHHAFFSLDSLNIEHLGPFSMFIMKGWLGVDLFFILSGFILAYSYHEKLTDINFLAYKTFLIKRIAKIFPLHVTILLFYGILVLTAHAYGFSFDSEKHSLQNFLSQMLLLHGIGIIEPEGWNLPSWSVSSEMFAYFFFPIITYAIARNKFSMRYHVVLIIGLLATTVLMGWILNDGKKFMLDYEYTAIRVLSEFLMGISLFYIARNLNKNYRYLLTFIASTGLLFVTTLIANHSFFDFVYLIFFMGIILSLALIPSKMVRIPVLTRLGQISYAFYLIHSLILIGMNQIIRYSIFLQSNPALIVGAFMLITIVTAWLLYELIEKPGIKLIVNRYNLS
jgi:peptidoglycan/LPS O-acetylase OafA/YrhL